MKCLICLKELDEKVAHFTIIKSKKDLDTIAAVVPCCTACFGTADYHLFVGRINMALDYAVGAKVDKGLPDGLQN